MNVYLLEKKEQDVIDEYSQVLYEKYPCINNILVSTSIYWFLALREALCYALYSFTRALALLLLLIIPSGERHSTHFTAWVTCPNHRTGKWQMSGFKPSQSGCRSQASDRVAQSHSGTAFVVRGGWGAVGGNGW